MLVLLLFRRKIMIKDMYFDKFGREITDMLEWARLFNDISYSRIGFLELLSKEEKITISTVWLGINHSFSRSGLPLIFETMVFGSPLDGEQERYSTLEEAQEGHRIMVEWVKEVLLQKEK
jgi:hypothetical protein